MKKADSAGCFVASMLSNHLPGLRVWKDSDFISVDKKITSLPIIPDCQITKKYGNWPLEQEVEKSMHQQCLLEKHTSKMNLKDYLL